MKAGHLEKMNCSKLLKICRLPLKFDFMEEQSKMADGGAWPYEQYEL